MNNLIDECILLYNQYLQSDYMQNENNLLSSNDSELLVFGNQYIFYELLYYEDLSKNLCKYNFVTRFFEI